jgi:hypothetical protein
MLHHPRLNSVLKLFLCVSFYRRCTRFDRHDHRCNIGWSMIVFNLFVVLRAIINDIVLLVLAA